MNINPLSIDNLLPQTQCGLCGYNGCMPYARAIAEGKAPINKCLPGGVATLKAIANITNTDHIPYLEEMQQQTMPRQVAFIDEKNCIGCTKCIQACPVDAIVGARKLMHTIINSECTGCQLCISPCPTDCIELQPLPQQTPFNRDHAKARYTNHQRRLTQQQLQRQQRKQPLTDPQLKKQEILAAVARVQHKKGDNEPPHES